MRTNAGLRQAVARASRVVVLVAALAAGTGAAWAHPDLPIFDGAIRLAPGEALERLVPLHYHRVVGRYRVSGAGATQVSFTLQNALASGGQASVLARREGGRFNHLVSCCLGEDETPFRFRVRNEGPDEVEVTLFAFAAHDDLAVVTHRAEGGALEIPMMMFLGLGVAAGLVSWRRRPLRARADDQSVPPALRFSMAAAVISSAGGLALAVAGMLRYGGGPLEGLIAAMADLPVSGGPYGSRDALVLGLVMLAWLAAIGAWVRALGVAGPRHARRVAYWGLFLAGVSLAMGVLVGWTYGSYPVPVALGVALGAPLLMAAVAALPRGEPGAALAR